MLIGDLRGSLNKSHQAGQAILGSRDALGSGQKNSIRRFAGKQNG
jgi:hypothetical protein